MEYQSVQYTEQIIGHFVQYIEQKQGKTVQYIEQMELSCSIPEVLCGTRRAILQVLGFPLRCVRTFRISQGGG